MFLKFQDKAVIFMLKHSQSQTCLYEQLKRQRTLNILAKTLQICAALKLFLKVNFHTQFKIKTLNNTHN